MSSAAATPNLQHTPPEPSYFDTSTNLLRVTRQKANTLDEFLAALHDCPEGSIFQHSFQTL